MGWYAAYYRTNSLSSLVAKFFSINSTFTQPSFSKSQLAWEKILKTEWIENRVKKFPTGWRCLRVLLQVILHQPEDIDLVSLRDFLQEEMNLLMPTDTVQDIFHSKSESAWTNNGKGKGNIIVILVTIIS